MITERDFVWIIAKGSTTPLGSAMPRSSGERWMIGYRARGNRGPAVYELVPVPFCQVCGTPLRKLGEIRCRKHAGRNPCAIEGCKRSTSAGRSGYRNDLWLCGTHWRALVPPGSAERKIYNRFFRRWKRYGETDDSIRAFWRFWFRMISRARARGRGDLDVAEINRVMGW